MTRHVLIAPSVLSADFGRLAESVAMIEEAGADFIHVDVMDGHFVPNLTIGPPVVRALKRVAKRPLDVHLMISNPEASAAWYLDAGADLLTVHVEAATHLHRLVETIHDHGAKAGVSINPGTPVESLREILPEIDLALVMSVNPGFGGQSYIPASTEKVARLAHLRDEVASFALIMVDGGITAANAREVFEAGADALVAGNAVFGAEDPAAALAGIRRAAETQLA